jgi:phosphoadenosine phosphosulfate reductase
MIEKIQKDIQTNLRKYNQELVDMNPKEMLTWGYEKFDNQFAITTSFGIQSSVLLNMVNKLRLQKKNQNFLDRYRLPSSRNIPLC